MSAARIRVISRQFRSVKRHLVIHVSFFLTVWGRAPGRFHRRAGAATRGRWIRQPLRRPVSPVRITIP